MVEHGSSTTRSDSMLDYLSIRDTKFGGRCFMALAFAGAIVVQGCSSDDDATPQTDGGGQTEGGACPSGGGPSGTATDHCMGMFQEVGTCMMEPEDGGGAEDGGAEPEPPTNNGHEADDDDCKYHVAFTNDCVQKDGTGTTFTVNLTSLTKNMMAVEGAKAYIEAFLNENHPAGGTMDGSETSTGVYKIGPVVFDQPGKWTVRFHFFGGCSDIPEDSPHAHAAFFINVP
jgi:hypothetical protein